MTGVETDVTSVNVSFWRVQPQCDCMCNIRIRFQNRKMRLKKQQRRKKLVWTLFLRLFCILILIYVSILLLIHFILTNCFSAAARSQKISAADLRWPWKTTTESTGWLDAMGSSSITTRQEVASSDRTEKKKKKAGWRVLSRDGQQLTFDPWPSTRTPLTFADSHDVLLPAGLWACVMVECHLSFYWKILSCFFFSFEWQTWQLMTTVGPYQRQTSSTLSVLVASDLFGFKLLRWKIKRLSISSELSWNVEWLAHRKKWLLSAINSFLG